MTRTRPSSYQITLRPAGTCAPDVDRSALRHEAVDEWGRRPGLPPSCGSDGPQIITVDEASGTSITCSNRRRLSGIRQPLLGRPPVTTPSNPPTRSSPASRTWPGSSRGSATCRRCTCAWRTDVPGLANTTVGDLVAGGAAEYVDHLPDGIDAIPSGRPGTHVIEFFPSG